MAFRQTAAEHGEVLAEYEHQPPVDRAAPGDDAIAGDLLVRHAEIDAVVLHEAVEFLEAAFVQQHVQPFARGQLALGMLCGDAFLAPAQFGGGAAAFQFGDICGHGHSRMFGMAVAAPPDMHNGALGLHDAMRGETAGGVLHRLRA